jgi:hypothetical protein
MKPILFTLGLLAVTASAFAQNCNTYFAFKKGGKFEITSYDKKDKPAAVLRYTVTEAKPVSGGLAVDLDVETLDAKGRQIAKAQSSGKCVGGTYFTDIRNFASDQMPVNADMKVTVTGDQLAYPANLSAGDKLKDASINAKTQMGGMTLMNMDMTISNRQVAGNETVTTPAGTFDCVKLTYTIQMKLMGNRTLTATEWLAPGAGVVKTEQYDDKGRKVGSSLLTKREM